MQLLITLGVGVLIGLLALYNVYINSLHTYMNKMSDIRGRIDEIEAMLGRRLRR